MIRNHIRRWGWKSERSGDRSSDDDVVSVTGNSSSEWNDTSFVMQLRSISEMEAPNPQLLLSSSDDDRAQVYDDAAAAAASAVTSEESRTAAAVAHTWLNHGADGVLSLEKENSVSSLLLASHAVVVPSPRGRNLPSPLGRSLPSPLGLNAAPRNSSSLEEGVKQQQLLHCTTTPRSSLSSPPLALAEVDSNSPTKSNTNNNNNSNINNTPATSTHRLGSSQSVMTLTTDRSRSFTDDDKKSPSHYMELLKVSTSQDHHRTSPSLSGGSQASSVLSSFSSRDLSQTSAVQSKESPSIQVSAQQRAKPIASPSGWNNPSSKHHAIFLSASSPDGHVQEAVQQMKRVNPSSAVVVDDNPFERAYKVWRSKGLMPNGKIERSVIPSSYTVFDDALDSKLRSRRTEPRNGAITTGRHSLPVTSSADKTKGKGEIFANILQKWKTISEDNPTSSHVLSPGQAASAQQIIQRQQKSSKHGSELQPKAGAARETMNAVCLVRLSNPAASIPILQSRDNTLSPVRKAPKSQAWKLKMGREQRTQEKQKRASIAAVEASSVTGSFRQFKSPAKSRSDYKSVVRDFLREVDDKTRNDRAKSVPRSILRNERSPTLSIATGARLPLLPPDLGPSTPVVEYVSNNTYKRSHSQPRLRYQPSDSSMTAIRSQLQRENDDMRQSLGLTPRSIHSIKSTPRTASVKSAAGQSSERHAQVRVMDLDINDNVDEKLRLLDLGRNDNEEEQRPRSIPREVQIAPTESELFSPYTKRVMRNLEKAYDENDDVQTPRGMAAYSDRPWHRDRLLRRVESLSQEPSTAFCQCCSCSNSVFSGNDDMIEFFLPLMGTACSCGKTSTSLLKPDEPTSLVNILRPWQVTFLAGFGIYRGDELVKANHRSGSALAQALQQYRKREGMTPFRSKSHVMALQIWSKTSKAFVRSIRNQIKAARTDNTESLTDRGRPTPLRLPNTLYILSSFMDNMPSDGVPMISTTASISTCSRSSFGNSTTMLE